MRGWGRNHVVYNSSGRGHKAMLFRKMVLYKPQFPAFDRIFEQNGTGDSTRLIVRNCPSSAWKKR